MAKYGMSMCVLGMHEELRPDRIAVNALWPRTGIPFLYLLAHPLPLTMKNLFPSHLDRRDGDAGGR